MKSPYTAITVIFNPSSSGHSEKLARDLQKRLLAAAPHLRVELVPTEFARHAEELAKQAALATAKPLVISASGDGGYNEVINGLMKAKALGAKPTAGLLPAGNANDHHRNLHHGDIVEAILRSKTQRVDLLMLQANSNNLPVERYAHSYIGLGLTPQVGQKLNSTQLNRLKEVLIVIRVLVSLKPVTLIINRQAHAYDSLIISNVPKMSKYFKVSPQAKVNDGKFELTMFRWRNKLKFVRWFIAASTTGMPLADQRSHFSFRTLYSTPAQLDGEILTLDAKTKVVVTIKHNALRCVV